MPEVIWIGVKLLLMEVPSTPDVLTEPTQCEVLEAEIASPRASHCISRSGGKPQKAERKIGGGKRRYRGGEGIGLKVGTAIM
jgi:hypothetical protein